MLSNIIFKNYYKNRSLLFYYHNYNNDIINNCIKNKIIHNQKLFDFIISLYDDKIISEDNICLEVGTHIGSITCLLCILFQKIYAFEANPEIYKIIKLNIEENKFNNIILSDKAIDNNNDIIKVEYHDISKRNISSWGINFKLTDLNNEDNIDSNNTINVDNHKKYLIIETVTIDSLNLCIDLIITDVNTDLNVILGSINTIIKYRPIIILQDWGNYPSINIKLTSYKYKFIIDLNYSIIQIGDKEFSPYFCLMPIEKMKHKELFVIGPQHSCSRFVLNILTKHPEIKYKHHFSIPSDLTGSPIKNLKEYLNFILNKNSIVVFVQRDFNYILGSNDNENNANQWKTICECENNDDKPFSNNFIKNYQLSVEYLIENILELKNIKYIFFSMGNYQIYDKYYLKKIIKDELNLSYDKYPQQLNGIYDIFSLEQKKVLTDSNQNIELNKTIDLKYYSEKKYWNNNGNLK